MKNTANKDSKKRKLKTTELKKGLWGQGFLDKPQTLMRTLFLAVFLLLEYFIGR